MSLMTFIVIIVLGAIWGHHAPADTTGPAFNSLGNYPKTTTDVPVTQVGINGLAYDVGVMVLFLFEVVFMETAGYIIIGAIAERISFAGFLLAEIAMGAVIYPIFGNWLWGGGWLAHLGSSM